MERRLVAILAADIVGYSALMAQDEDSTLELLRVHRASVFEPVIAEHGGSIVKLMGDGTLVEFPSASGAVEAALAIQRRMAAAPGGIALRIGLNVGDVMDEAEDIYGDGVNIAARLEALAPAGGICLSGQLRDCLSPTLAAEFAEAGTQRVKNIARPIQVFRWPVSAGQLTQSETDVDLGRAATVAVARFEDMTTGAEHRHLAAGLAEDLITALSRIDGLHAMPVGGEDSSQLAPQARELGAAYLARGMVRTAGDRLRITAQLFDCTNDETVWADRFDGSTETDVFDFLDQVTDRIAAALQVHLSDGEQAVLWRREAADEKAYDLFLAGRASYADYSRRSNLRARTLYSEALERSPEFVSAIAGLARTYIEAAAYGWSDDRERSLAEARRLLEEAFALAPDHALVHSETAHLLMIEGRFEDARYSAQRAARLAPDLGDTFHVLAFQQLCVGEFHDALRNAREAVRRSPTAPEHYLTAMAEAHIGLRQFAEALPVVRRILERRPDWLSAQVLQVIALMGAGRETEAREAAAKLIADRPRFTVARWRRMIFFPDRDDIPGLCSMLAAAGVPE